ncbi:MAG: hypothetical protein ABSB42_07865 [Tepidisphaeraceae bacterium]|jgi:hypothetical protein
MSEKQPLYGLAEVAKRLHVKVSTVLYAVKTRGIQPYAKLSRGRVYDEAGVQQIAVAILDAKNDPRGNRKPKAGETPIPAVA